ncbi:MAG: hypothetical protein EOO04_34750 [Chitinophagaceae bacterium]|nr:MAG: hypothetical protein EOO04_34750 [Chitinophagaceae bacterium]
MLLFKGLKKKYKQEAGDLYITDIVCSALAKECSKEIIDAARKHFLPDYQPLNLDYACKPDAPDQPFPSEDEMILFFTDNPGHDQFFYWNQQQDNPDKVMLGAHITHDHHLIISLTLNGTSTTRANYYHALKTLLHADAATISYSTPAKYDDGADFIRRYQNQQHDFEKP